MTSAVLRSGEKFRLNYVPTEFGVSYEVYLKDGDNLTPAGAEEKFSLNSIFGLRRATATVNRWFSVDVTAPEGYYARVYIGASNLFQPSQVPADQEKFPQEEGYGSNRLGEDVSWKDKDESAKNAGGIVDTGQATPQFFSRSGTYASGRPGSAQSDQKVCVVLEKRQLSEYQFNVDYFTKARTGDAVNSTKMFNEGDPQIAMNGDGTMNGQWSFTTKLTSGMYHVELRSLEINGISLNIPYIETPSADTVGATAQETTTLPSGAKVTLKVTAVDLDTPTGRYQRKYDLTVENCSRDIYLTYGTLINDMSGYREVVLSELSGVEVQLWANQHNENYYKWRDNTEGNSLRCGQQYNFAYMYTNKNMDTAQNGNQYPHDTESDNPYEGNVRFRLKEGYAWATNDGKGVWDAIRFVNKSGLKEQTFTEDDVLGPDSAGWYYVTLTDQNTANNSINLLRIEAQMEQYEIHYADGKDSPMNEGLSDLLSGGASVRNMPVFQDGASAYTTTDDNYGRYYSISDTTGGYSGFASYDRITISGRSPSIRGAERPATFRCWVVTDADGNPLDQKGQKITGTGDLSNQYQKIYPADMCGLENLISGAELIDEAKQNYAIYLTAWWELPANDFSYYVTYNRTEADGTQVTRFTGDIAYQGGSAVMKRETYSGAQSVNLVLDTAQAGGPDEWLKEPQNIWYKYDTTKNGSRNHAGQFYWAGVQNEGEMDVWFISSLGHLDVKKTVQGASDPDTEFPFAIAFTLPADDGNTQGNEANYFGTGSYTVSYTLDDGKGGGGTSQLSLQKRGSEYTGTLKLKDGQTASFALPAGTSYTIEEQLDDLDYETQDPKRNGSVLPNTKKEEAYVNRPANRTGTLIVQKRLAGASSAAPGEGFLFYVTFEPPQKAADYFDKKDQPGAWEVSGTKKTTEEPIGKTETVSLEKQGDEYRGSFRLSAGESIAFVLPPDTKWHLTEQPSPSFVSSIGNGVSGSMGRTEKTVDVINMLRSADSGESSGGGKRFGGLPNPEKTLNIGTTAANPALTQGPQDAVNAHDEAGEQAARNAATGDTARPVFWAFLAVAGLLVLGIERYRQKNFKKR